MLPQKNAPQKKKWVDIENALKETSGENKKKLRVHLSQSFSIKIFQEFCLCSIGRF